MSGRPSGAPVLVVDDEPQVRDLLRVLLEGRGDGPLAAGNVTEAREALIQHEVHLVLCDVDMPGGSGLELVHEAIALMKAARGTQFDPAVLDVFLDALEDSLLLRVTASRLGARIPSGAEVSK